MFGRTALKKVQPKRGEISSPYEEYLPARFKEWVPSYQDDVIVAPKKMLTKLNEVTHAYAKARGTSAASSAFRFGSSAAGKVNIKKVLDDESSEELVSPFFENEWGRG